MWDVVIHNNSNFGHLWKCDDMAPTISSLCHEFYDKKQSGILQIDSISDMDCNWRNSNGDIKSSTISSSSKSSRFNDLKNSKKFIWADWEPAKREEQEWTEIYKDDDSVPASPTVAGPQIEEISDLDKVHDKHDEVDGVVSQVQEGEDLILSGPVLLEPHEPLVISENYEFEKLELLGNFACVIIVEICIQ